MSPGIAGSSPPDHRPASRFARLSVLDLMFLRVESAAWPCHFGGLAMLDGPALLDRTGRLRSDEIAAELDRRLVHAPQLRRRVHFPGPLQGQAAMGRRRTVRHPLPRSADRGRSPRRRHRTPRRRRPHLRRRAGPHLPLVGAVVLDRPVRRPRRRAVQTAPFGGRRHRGHSAHGLAVRPRPRRPSRPPSPGHRNPAPTGWQLFRDNLAAKTRHARHARRGASALAHPIRLARALHVLADVTRRALSPARAPRTSLNRRVQTGRRIRFLQLNLPADTHAAHAHQGKVNDVVLTIWTGGLRHLLASRAEPVERLEPITTIPTSSRPAGGTGTTGNEFGAMSLALPL